LLEASDSTLEKGLKMLGAKTVVEYYVLDIPNLPETLKSNLFIYIPKDKSFAVCEKNPKLDKDDFVSLSTSVSYKDKSNAYVTEPVFTSTDPQDILNTIELHRCMAKGLSREASEWLEEEIATEEINWEEAVEKFLITQNPTDTDYKALGKKKEDYKLPRSSHKFGLR